MLSGRRSSISGALYDATKHSIAVGVTTAGATLASRTFSSLLNSKRAKKSSETPLKSAVTAGATAALTNQLSECTSLALNEITQSHGVLNNMAASAVSMALLTQFVRGSSVRRAALAPVHVALSSILFSDEPLHSRLPPEINDRYSQLKDLLLDSGPRDRRTRCRSSAR